MKRYLVILVLVISIGILLASESSPSSTVGYFKKSVASGGWEAFTLPFAYADLSPNSVLGEQFNDLDMLIDMNDPLGANAMYLTGAGWVGELASMAYGHTYWINRDMGSPDVDYFIMGTVDPQPVVLHVAGSDEGNWSSFGLNEAAPVDINTLVIPGAVDLDMIIDFTSPTGENAMYLDGVGWVGELVNLIPTHAYWYNSNSGTSFDWNYPAASRNATTTSGNIKTGVERTRVTK